MTARAHDVSTTKAPPPKPPVNSPQHSGPRVLRIPWRLSRTLAPDLRWLKKTTVRGLLSRPRCYFQKLVWLTCRALHGTHCQSSFGARLLASITARSVLCFHCHSALGQQQPCGLGHEVSLKTVSECLHLHAPCWKQSEQRGTGFKQVVFGASLADGGMASLGGSLDRSQSRSAGRTSAGTD